MSSRNLENPFINFIRLMRLSDWKTGSSEQMNYIAEFLEFNNKIMRWVLQSLDSGPREPIDLAEVLSEMSHVFESMETLVAFQIERTRKFFDPLRRQGENVDVEVKELLDVERDWEKAIQDLRQFEGKLNEEAKNPSSTFTAKRLLDELSILQKELSLPMEKLDLIDDRVISKASNVLKRLSSTKATIRVDDIFRLFTSEP